MFTIFLTEKMRSLTQVLWGTSNCNVAVFVLSSQSTVLNTLRSPNLGLSDSSLSITKSMNVKLAQIEAED